MIFIICFWLGAFLVGIALGLTHTDLVSTDVPLFTYVIGIVLVLTYLFHNIILVVFLPT